MYRESLLGTALAITLEEIAANLNEGQRERIWKVFDQTMNECLSEAPLMTRVQVRVRPPTSLTDSRWIEKGKFSVASKKSTLVSLDPAVEEAPLDPLAADSCSSIAHGGHITSRSSEALSNSTRNNNNERKSETSSCPVEELSCALNDPSLAFPIYRCVDGVWTIILKDPEVTVRDEFGVEEVLKLDFLKVYLQHLPSANPGSLSKSSRVRSGAKYPAGLQSWNPERKKRNFKRERE